jgi:hypothetical protein
MIFFDNKDFNPNTKETKMKGIAKTFFCLSMLLLVSYSRQNIINDSKHNSYSRSDAREKNRNINLPMSAIVGKTAFGNEQKSGQGLLNNYRSIPSKQKSLDYAYIQYPERTQNKRSRNIHKNHTKDTANTLNDSTSNIFMPLLTAPELYDIRYGDFNGDGRTDLAYNNGSNLFICYNAALPGQVSGVNTGLIIYGNDNLNSVLFLDFNGDGRTDIGFVNYYDHNLYICLSIGQSDWARTTLIMSSAMTSYAFGDFNGDGKMDIATKNNSTHLSICYNVSDISHSSWTDTALIIYGADGLASCAFNDFSGDGKTDIAFVNYNNHVIYYCTNINSAGSSQWDCSPSLLTNGDFTSLYFGDFDGDGKADVAYKDGSYLSACTNITDSENAKWNNTGIIIYGTDGLKSCVFRDFSGDGRIDIGFKHYYDHNLYISYGFASEQKTDWDNTQLRLDFDPSSYFYEDLNQDGKTDISYKSSDSKLYTCFNVTEHAMAVFTLQGAFPN